MDKIKIRGGSELKGVFPISGVPAITGVRWVVPEGLTAARPDIVVFEELGVPLIDLVASSDAIVAKPGYGTFAEAIGAGTRLLYTDRPHWPETPYLTDWACAQGVAAGLGPGDRDMERFAQAITALLQRPLFAPPALTGAAEGARLIASV